MGSFKNETRSFTNISNKLEWQLKNRVVLMHEDKEIECVALWDTGATDTLISRRVAEKLNLPIKGKSYIYTPSGKKEVNIYTVNIVLPNNVGVADINVRDSEIANQGIDVLIGMDVILLGDFAVSTYNGQTAFSFRIPSQGHIDFEE